jgi:alkanesulfonate monooxygenase SsuD/methylene tetrahydromethanopterin reductase-like flavin-dependent oxidoreductase (luciferase family)
MRLGTGIVGVFQRGPALLAQEAAALSDASEGRFVLGIGSSSDRIIEGWNQIPFEKPLSKVRETLEFLQVALKGERTSTRFKLETKPAYEIPIVLAALRGRMLELAVEQADGAFTNFLPLDGLPQVVAPLADAPDDFELLCRFFCLPGTREEVEPVARYMFSTYITVPVYTEFYKWLGWGERIQPMLDAWNAGDRQKAAAEAPWEAIEQMFIFGSPAEMKERLEAFVAGGITCPILTMVCPPEKLAGMIDDLAR